MAMPRRSPKLNILENDSRMVTQRFTNHFLRLIPVCSRITGQPELGQPTVKLIGKRPWPAEMATSRNDWIGKLRNARP